MSPTDSRHLGEMKTSTNDDNNFYEMVNGHFNMFFVVSIVYILSSIYFSHLWSHKVGVKLTH